MLPETCIVSAGHVAVALSGEVDIVAAPAAREALARAASQALAGVVIDLSEVTFMDAAGLGVLAGAIPLTRHLPDGLRLVAVPARVLRLLTVTGLDHHLAAFPAPRDMASERRLLGQIAVRLHNPQVPVSRRVP